MSHKSVLLLGLATLLSLTPTTRAESLWIEAESLANPPAASSTGFAKPEWLSGGKVLSLILDPKQVEAALPADGLILSYPLALTKAGNYTLWNRVGFEGVRAALEWRVNQGPWTLNSQVDQPITNVQELAFWNPIGWTRLGIANLTAGKHTLDIRLTRTLADPKDPNKGFAQVNYVSDAFFVTDTPLRPNFHLQPGTPLDPELAAAAASQRFTLKDDPSAPRQSLDLSGLWQFAAYDEIGEISEESRVAGAANYPDLSSLTWHGLAVPSDRNTALPATRYSHRFILRTSVDVPASFKGAGYQLNFEALNLITTLFVNGTRIGDFDTAKSRWLVDVSAAIKPGVANEILLVVKDTYYGLALSGGDKGEGMRRTQYYPDSLFNGNQGVNHRFDFPVANGHGQSGILDTPTLIATRAPLYVADTFVKPFPTTKKQIIIETTVRNAGPSAASATLRQTIVSWPDAKPVATIGETRLDVAPGATATATLTTPSDPLKLWWIYDPTLYNLVTEVSLNGKVIDRHTTRFGNREWEIRGNQFYLNGVKQNLRHDLTHYGVNTPLPLGDILSEWKEMGVNMFRRRDQFPWNGLSPRQTLAWMDEVGMPVRMGASTFDGQLASYNLTEGSGKDRTARRALFDRWHAQMMNGVNTWKNHPSVFIWELDNEIVYINSRNFGTLKEVEPEFTKTSNAVLAFDPTRSTVTGGGRALLDESLPTYGIHYFETADRDYPDEAYTGTITTTLEGSDKDGRVWPYNFDNKPTFLSETAFLPGRNAAQFAAFGGEITFLGKSEAKPAAGLYASWIAEGYRWKGYAANSVWFAKDFTDGSYTYAWQPVAILRREWNRTFATGQKVTRTLRVYNDLPDTRPITATWTLEIGGRTITSETKTFNVAPGTFEPWPITVPMPATATARTEGRILLTATRAGNNVFTHSLPVALHPEAKPTPVKLSGPLVIWDPSGEALARLKATGYQNIQSVTTLAQVPATFGLLVVGRNALSETDATDRRWTALASSGNKILLLEQDNPLHFQAIPADLVPSGFTGRMSFPQNIAHPIFAGLTPDDLSLWAGDHIVYQNALRKPTKGASSLVQCDDQLDYTALALAPVDEGLIVMNQLVVARKLDTEIVARHLFDNLVAYTATYQKVTRAVVTSVQDPLLNKTLTNLGLTGQQSTDPVAALASHPGGILLIEGNPANLNPLAAAPEALQKFWSTGGYLYVKNITPDSLAAFNKIVGYEHILRPFREELVLFPVPPNPLTAGLTLRDAVMGSGKRIQSWSRDEWPADDAFDHIVDLNDIAPFATFPAPSAFGYSVTGPGTDNWPLNMVNGYTSATHWRVSFTLGLNDKNQSRPIELQLPRQETLTSLRLTPSPTFRTITKLRLVFDGDPATAQEFDLGTDLVANLALTPQAARAVSIQIIATKDDNTKVLSGIDNFSLLVERPADFDEKVRPMLNIGGLVEYPRAKGGVILDQFVTRQNESNPINAEKKKTLLSTVLRNLGADLGGAKTSVAGFNLRYAPLSLEGFANLYLTTGQGWSAPGGDLSALPRGANTFADVRYQIRDFSTSPLESAATLKHPQLKSNATAETLTAIPVNTTADTLFFLHTFMETKTWKPQGRETEAPELFQYVIHYEDGTQALLPVKLDHGVAAWLQAPGAKSLPKAEIAWSGPAIGGKNPTLYQFQWDNPHPAKKILTIDLAYSEKGKDYGAPALLAVTAAQVSK